MWARVKMVKDLQHILMQRGVVSLKAFAFIIS